MACPRLGMGEFSRNSRALLEARISVRVLAVRYTSDDFPLSFVAVLGENNAIWPRPLIIAN